MIMHASNFCTVCIITDADTICFPQTDNKLCLRNETVCSFLTEDVSGFCCSVSNNVTAICLSAFKECWVVRTSSNRYRKISKSSCKFMFFFAFSRGNKHQWFLLRSVVYSRTGTR